MRQKNYLDVFKKGEKQKKLNRKDSWFSVHGCKIRQYATSDNFHIKYTSFLNLHTV